MIVAWLRVREHDIGGRPYSEDGWLNHKDFCKRCRERDQFASDIADGAHLAGKGET